MYLLVLFYLAGCGRRVVKQPVSFMDDKVPIIAVFPFENRTNDTKLNWLSEGIAESIITELVKDKRFKIVERIQIKKIYEELRFQLGELVDPKTRVKMGKMLNCDFVITGAFQKIGRKIKIYAERTEVETSVVYEAVSVIGNIDDIFALQEKLAKKLLKAFEK